MNKPSLFNPDETTKKFLPPDFVKNLDNQRGTGITYEPKTNPEQPNKLKKVLVKLGVVATGAVILFSYLEANSNNEAEPSNESKSTEEIVVKPGDNAWDIANDRTSDENDVRKLVDDIMDQAHEADGQYGLQGGERITVPPTTKPQD
jgi:hypothetical protein